MEAIAARNNNLVQWREKARMNQFCRETLHKPRSLQQLEFCFFRLYRQSSEAESFTELTEILGQRYALVAYFFFLKDASRFAPIAPTYFDKAFESVGAKFQTSHACSWENFSHFVALLGELRFLLQEKLNTEVTLLDAHTFVWMLGAEMRREGRVADHLPYQELSDTERDALNKVRLCQGIFRDKLVNY